MRVKRWVQKLLHGGWLCLLSAVPAAALTPTSAADLTHQLTSVWVPATAYGFTLIAAMMKTRQ